MKNLFDDLTQLAGKHHTGKPCVLMIKGNFVCGAPYDMTAYRERAFVFGSMKDAREIARKHFPRQPRKILREHP